MCKAYLIALVRLPMLLLLLSTLCATNMEQVNFGYSLKNIPIPSNQEYLLELVSSVEIFISNLRWRSFHFLNPSNKESRETFGLKTSNPAPYVKELKEFENSMHGLVKNVKFRRTTNNNLQTTLKTHMQEMKGDNRIYVAADKTTNYYKVSPEKYKEMMQKENTKEYKKAKESDLEKLNKEDKHIAEKLEIDDRLYAFTKRDSFITIKDHKDNFENNTKCRLINPAKSDLGKISKKILARIVTSVKERTKLNLWKNTDSVIEWFKNLNNKEPRFNPV